MEKTEGFSGASGSDLSRGGSSRKRKQDSESDSDAVDELDDMVLEKSMAEFEKAKEALEQRRDANITDFVIVVLGGKWTVQHKKQPFEKYR